VLDLLCPGVDARQGEQGNRGRHEGEARRDSRNRENPGRDRPGCRGQGRERTVHSTHGSP
jgi:hypothetical protein